MIKFAVVGLGSIGNFQLDAVAKSQYCEISAVCDLNETLAKEFADKYNVPYFTDYHDIPEKTEADAVILNLPHFLHCEATVFFLKNGLHVLVEKPMANSVEECDKMIEAAEKSGKKLAVGHIQRFFEANRTVRQYVENGALGKLVMTEEHRTVNYFADSRPRWFLQKKTAGGGIVMNYGAHALDKLFYITGMRSAEITAYCGNLKNDFDVEGHSQSLLKFSNGVSSSVTFSGYHNSGYDVYYYFTDGALRVSGGDKLYRNVSGEWEQVELPNAEFVDTVRRQLEEFVKMISGEESEITDAEYGRDVMMAIEKIYGKDEQK